MRMRIFVLAFVIVWIGEYCYYIVMKLGPLVHRITGYWRACRYDIPAIQWWDALSESLVGLVNAIIWVSHPLVVKSIKGFIRVLLSRKNNSF